MALLRFPKGSKVRVGKYFVASDFDCPCGRQDCQETLIELRLIELLDATRDILGVPLYVRRGDGCRCQWYEDELERRGYATAKGRSQHVQDPEDNEPCKAADISTGKHSGEQIEDAARQAGFMAVGVAKTWAHVDTRGGRERRWVY